MEGFCQQKEQQEACSAVVVIADRTAYYVRYNYRPLSGIAVVSISI